MRLLTALILFKFRFFATALGISRLRQHHYLRLLRDDAGSLGLSGTASDNLDKGDLMGTISDVPVRVEIQLGESSRTGTFLGAPQRTLSSASGRRRLDCRDNPADIWVPLSPIHQDR